MGGGGGAGGVGGGEGGRGGGGGGGGGGGAGGRRCLPHCGVNMSEISLNRVNPLMVSNTATQQDSGYTWCTVKWDGRLQTHNPIRGDNWAQDQSNTFA